MIKRDKKIEMEEKKVNQDATETGESGIKNRNNGWHRFEVILVRVFLIVHLVIVLLSVLFHEAGSRF